MAIGSDDIARLAAFQTAMLSRSNELFTQDMVALKFAERHGGQLLYDHHQGSWFIWTGSHWRREETSLAFDWARELARDLSTGESPKTRIAANKTDFAGGVERFARSDRVFAVTSENWDRNPLLLGTPGGTVDLTTGKVRPAAPDDRITKITALAPQARADCPRWLQFLEQSTGRDAELIRFLQQWCGYS